MKTIREIKTGLDKDIYDALLMRLYNCDKNNLFSYKTRIKRILDGMVNTFSLADDAHTAVISSPGRAELSGNHTDHQGGQVLTGTVTLDTLCCACKSESPLVRVASEGFEKFTIDLSDLSPSPCDKNSSAALVKGVLQYFSKKGIKLSGLDIYITSDVPPGSGLSSSASFSVAIAIIINHLFCSDRFDIYEIAKSAKYAENEYFGKPCGLMDQMAIALGGINYIDFSTMYKTDVTTGNTDDTPFHKSIDFSFEACGYSVFIIDTGSSHSTLSEDFDAIPREMSAVAEALGKNYLSDICEDNIYKNMSQLQNSVGDRALLRAIHWFNECKRVKAQSDALSDGDINTFSKLASESGRSSFMYLQNISSYRNPVSEPLALALAAADHLLDGRGAFRIHGGGFAGTIITFVPDSICNDFVSFMENIFGINSCKRIYIRSSVACVLPL